MNKEELQQQCNEDIDKLSLILHESKKDLRLVDINNITPIINSYISLAYDYGSLNGQNIGRTELLNSI
jgi:hypothetical protein